MPQSTNAELDEYGFSLVQRDIEYLYLKLQELFDQVSGQPAPGDLQPGGGQGVSQLVPQDAFGGQQTGTGAQSTAYGESGYTASAAVTATPQNVAFNTTNAPPGLSDSALTIPADGLYFVQVECDVTSFDSGSVSSNSGHSETLDLFVAGTSAAIASTTHAVELDRSGGSTPYYYLYYHESRLVVTTIRRFAAGNQVTAQLRVANVGVAGRSATYKSQLRYFRISA